MDISVQERLYFDFYGDLLTKHQQDILNLYYNEDFSIAEISENLKMSRQAIYDILKRSNRSLKEYEKKLKLVQNEIDRCRKTELIIKNISSVLDDKRLSANSKNLLISSIDLLNRLENKEENNDF